MDGHHPQRGQLLPLRVRPRLRRWHRLAAWLGAAPLLVATLTGVAFSWFDYAAVRGTNDRAPPPLLDSSHVQLRPSELAAGPMHTLTLRPLVDRAVYVIDDERAFDAATGAPLDVDATLAGAIAQTAHVARPHVAAVAAASASDVDLAQPAWRVRLADARHTDVFVARRTGAILGWRNDAWRRFDVLWSLHVLGYVSRDNPAHAPMRIVAALALLVTLTGLPLLLLLVRRKRASP